MKAIINGKVLHQGTFKSKIAILYDQRIIDLVDDVPSDIEVIDAKGNYVLPGFVDVHVHGAKGADVMDGSRQALETISKGLAETGVTRFLATTMTMEMEKIYEALDTVREAMKSPLPGAKTVGVHLEGPFISEAYKGAQNPRHIIKPSWEMVSPYLDVIKVMTIAVEEDEDLAFVKNNPGVKLSIGHSSADFEKALEAYDHGVCHCTHCFNGMTGLHHRKPGIVGAVFTKPYETEFIADGVHIHPGFLGTFVRIIGEEQAILITDSMRAGGMKEGTYDLGGQEVRVDKTSARLADGTLAGSILTIDQAIRNMIEHTDYPLESIINMATINPAKSIVNQPDYGFIKEGNLADFVIMSEDLQVLATIVDGEVVYQKGNDICE